MGADNKVANLSLSVIKLAKSGGDMSLQVDCWITLAFSNSESQNDFLSALKNLQRQGQVGFVGFYPEGKFKFSHFVDCFVPGGFDAYGKLMKELHFSGPENDRHVSIVKERPFHYSPRDFELWDEEKNVNSLCRGNKSRNATVQDLAPSTVIEDEAFQRNWKLVQILSFDDYAAESNQVDMLSICDLHKSAENPASKITGRVIELFLLGDGGFACTAEQLRIFFMLLPSLARQLTHVQIFCSSNYDEELWCLRSPDGIEERRWSGAEISEARFPNLPSWLQSLSIQIEAPT